MKECCHYDIENNDDEEEEGEGHNNKQYSQTRHRLNRQVRAIGSRQNDGDHSDDMEDFSGLQDFSENDLEEEEEEDPEDEDDEDLEEEDCHDDNISSTIGDEEDPRLCSPSTDSEDKCSPSPKQTRTTNIKYLSGGEDLKTTKNEVMVKNINKNFKTPSPEMKNIETEEESRKASSQASRPKGSTKSADIERAKSLPPHSITVSDNASNISKNTHNAKGAKRKSRPSSSSLAEENSGLEGIGNRSVKLATDKSDCEHLRSKKKRFCTSSQPNSKISPQIKDDDAIKNEKIPKSMSHQSNICNVDGSQKLSSGPNKPISIPATSSNIIASHDSDVWWSTAANVASTRERTSSVGSGPILSPDISVSQWQKTDSPCQQQTRKNHGNQAAKLAAVSVASNPTVTPPPPGPSTAMAELANLVNAHPRAGVAVSSETVHDMRPFLRNLAAQQQRWTTVDDNTPGMSGANVSCGLSEDNDSGLSQ